MGGGGGGGGGPGSMCEPESSHKIIPKASMANIKSQIKRNLQNERRRERNKSSALGVRRLARRLPLDRRRGPQPRMRVSRLRGALSRIDKAAAASDHPPEPGLPTQVLSNAPRERGERRRRATESIPWPAQAAKLAWQPCRHRSAASIESSPLSMPSDQTPTPARWNSFASATLRAIETGSSYQVSCHCVPSSKRV